MTTSVLDVIIIGGSYAGLSAAMALGRSRRQVLVIDSGKPCNRQTPHSHNFITHDGATPAAIAALAKEQVLQYPSVTFLTDTATHAAQQGDQFIITTASGQQYRGDKLLFATGLKDNMPAIPGFAACWGISVLHCPYCHGYEVREEKTGILAQGDGAFEMVKLILNWTADLTVFTNGATNFTPEQEAQLTAHQVRVITKPITHFQQEKGQIQEVVFEDGSRESITAMYARPPFTQHSDLPALLGCNIDEMGFITVDEFQQTNIPGIYAAGDNTTRLRAVSAAIGGGGKAGAFINHALIYERF